MSRRIARAGLAAALGAAVLLAGCTTPEPTPTPTPTEPPVHQGEAVPDALRSRCPARPADLEVVASVAFFAAAPVVVVAAPDADATLRARPSPSPCAPLLLEPVDEPPPLPAETPAADLTAEPTEGRPEPPGPAAALAAEIRRLALAVVTVGTCSPSSCAASSRPAPADDAVSPTCSASPADAALDDPGGGEAVGGPHCAGAAVPPAPEAADAEPARLTPSPRGR